MGLKKYQIREQFSLVVKNEDGTEQTLEGPAQVELDEKTALDNILKIEEIPAEKKAAAKKEA